MKKICAFSLLMLCFFIWADPARAAVIAPGNMLSAQAQEEQPQVDPGRSKGVFHQNAKQLQPSAPQKALSSDTGISDVRAKSCWWL